MTRVAILEPTHWTKAQALLTERGIAHHPDQRERVLWIHDASEADAAAKFLRDQGVRAVTY